MPPSKARKSEEMAPSGCSAGTPLFTVVAAVIKRNGRILICQRRKEDSFPLKWEFPVGKVRACEAPDEALRRELKEELGVTAAIGREIHRARHRYPEHEREIELIFYEAELGSAAAQNLAFEQMVWELPEKLCEYDFLAADRELVLCLAKARRD
jgi:8-oxo-dGTP diphosphatase